MKIKVIAILTAIILIVSYVPVNAETHIPNPPSDGYEYWAVIDYYGDVVLLTSSVPIVVTKMEIEYMQEDRQKIQDITNMLI